MSSVNIFKMGLEDAKPRREFSNDHVGAIKGGYVIGNRPVASTTVVFTTDDPAVADVVQGLYGGEVEPLEVEKGDDHRLVSTVTSVDLLIDDTDKIESSFVLFGKAGLVFRTDGHTILEGEDFAGNKIGDAWTPPENLRAWKAASRDGRAPQPEIVVRGRLVDSPDTGIFRYRTSSWSLVQDLPAVEAELETAVAAAEGQPVRVTLELVPVQFTAKDGTNVEYTKPTLKVHKPAAGLKAAA